MSIEYIDLKRGQIAVYLGDGSARRKKRVGIIHHRNGKRTKGGTGFQYVPNGAGNGNGGDLFPTLALCKRSIESD